MKFVEARLGHKPRAYLWPSTLRCWDIWRHRWPNWGPIAGTCSVRNNHCCITKYHMQYIYGWSSLFLAKIFATIRDWVFQTILKLVPVTELSGTRVSRDGFVTTKLYLLTKCDIPWFYDVHVLWRFVHGTRSEYGKTWVRYWIKFM